MLGTASHPPAPAPADSGAGGIASLPRAALSGVIAAGAALAAGELVTAADPTGPSLVTAVGGEFIDRFVARLKQLAVRWFGTHDKAALVVGIVVVSLLLGALIGMVARSPRRRWVGWLGMVAFGVVGVSSYVHAPESSPALGVVAGVVAVAIGIAALELLLARAADVAADAATLETAAGDASGDAGGDAEGAPIAPFRSEVDDGVSVDGRLVAAPMPAPERDPRHVSRRRFLVTAAAVAAGAAGAAVLSRRARAGDTTAAARRSITIPRPTRARPAPASQPFAVDGLTPYIVPSSEFYRIDTALTLPRIDVASWQLDVGGMVDHPFTLSFDHLLAMDSVEEVVTLQCVSNEVGGHLVGNATWQGVPLAALLDRAGVQAGATQVVGRSVDRFTAGFPTEVAGDGRVALVAYAMNGEPLPVEHGYPARLVVAGLYGYVSATKWLRAIELTTWDGVDGYWITRGWAKEGPIKIASRIDVPSASARASLAPTPIAGVAWAPSVGVSRVEVQVDDGPWLPARLGEVASENTWVQWLVEWQPTAGDHVLRVRAVDADGRLQTGEVAPPEPDGATGYHSRRVTVTGA